MSNFKVGDFVIIKTGILRGGHLCIITNTRRPGDREHIWVFICHALTLRRYGWYEIGELFSV
jgi:hypothetical protein